MNHILAVAGVVVKELFRRKDVYVLFVLTALITLVMGSVRFFGDARMGRYLKELCLLLIWISGLVIAVGLAARQLPAERESRTIFPLLAKPISRWQVMTGKFAGCWIATGLALVVFYLFLTLVSGSRAGEWGLVSTAQALWLHWFMLAIVIAMTLLGSVLFSAPSSNATVCLILTLGLLTVGRHLNKVALQMEGFSGTLVYGVYYVIPHLEWFDLRDLVTHAWGGVGWLPFLGATLYAILYTGLLLGAAWLRFRRQTLN